MDCRRAALPQLCTTNVYHLTFVHIIILFIHLNNYYYLICFTYIMLIALVRNLCSTDYLHFVCISDSHKGNSLFPKGYFMTFTTETSKLGLERNLLLTHVGYLIGEEIVIYFLQFWKR